MIKSCFSKLVFCMFLIMGLSCSFAFADEIAIQPVDSLYGGFIYNYGYPDQTFVSFDTKGSVPIPNPNRWYGGTQLNTNSYSVLYDPEMENLSWPNDSAYSLHLSDVFGSPFDHYTFQNSFVLSFPQCDITLDTTGYLAGYYRYECDFYYGLQLRPSFLTQASSDGFVAFQPEFTYFPDPYENNVGVITQYMGRVSTTNHLSGYWNRGVTSDLVHLFVSYTFYLDGNTNSVSLSPDFSVVGSLTYDTTAVRAIGDPNSRHSNDCSMFLNTRFYSKLYSNVEPPVTPTPTITPYPGQDTQESINAGVGQIESQVSQVVNILDVQATPIPTPADFTIDETLFDELETMTLPDVSEASAEYSALWEIFNPLWWFIGLLFSCLFVVGIFLYVLRGGFI